MDYKNYFINSKFTRLTKGHINSNQLLNEILSQNKKAIAYCCYFDLHKDYLKQEWDTNEIDKDGKPIYEYIPRDLLGSKKFKNNGLTFTAYEGPCRPALNFISFDFDDANNPENSLIDVNKFIDWLDNGGDCLTFYSGSKGFHIMVNAKYFNLAHDKDLPLKLKDLAKYLKVFFPTLDDSIYNYNRKFRVPFSKHDKSGLFKNLINPYDDMETIKKYCKTPKIKNVFEIKDVEYLESIDVALKESSRVSYEIEKEKAGSLAAPSPFEKFEGKLCIKKLLNSNCKEEGRNNSCLRIVNDFYRTGKTYKFAKDTIEKWAEEVGLSINEWSTILTNIYERGANYNFGCQDEIKSGNCSAKCPIWSKLAVDKRPTVVDSTPTQNRETNRICEFEVVEKVLTTVFYCNYDFKTSKFYNGTICRQGKKDLFFYNKGQWKHLPEERIDNIKIKINSLYENKMSSRQLKNVFEMLLIYVPSKPEHIDMFIPRSDVTNFTNGTLFLTNDETGYNFEFKPHDAKDYITTLIPFPYEESLSSVNAKFETWLKELLETTERYMIVQEMFGAVLMANFPQFFILVGASGSGKSTIIKVLRKMLGDNTDLICGVAPHQFRGFNLESMVGKLVNIVGDIRSDVTISDDVVKQVDDRDKIRIARKYQEDLYAPLCAVHIFAANELPKTLEGASGALVRRVKLINFDKVFEGVKVKDIADRLFSINPQGVINFAVKGLMRIVLDNGSFFSESPDSNNLVVKWTKSEDVLDLFYGELFNEGVEVNGVLQTIKKDKELRIVRTRLWKLYDAWQEESINNKSKISKTTFYNESEKRGFGFIKTNGQRCFKGLGESNSNNLVPSDAV